MTALLRLAAFLDRPGARERVDETWPCPGKPNVRLAHSALAVLTDAAWATAAVGLIEAVGERDCDCADGARLVGQGYFDKGSEVYAHERCNACKGTGKIRSPHLLLRAVLGVAKRCAQEHYAGCASYCVARPCGEQRRIIEALDACAAYLDDPSAERLEAWYRAWASAHGDNPTQWLPVPKSKTDRVGAAHRLNAARALLPLPAVEEAAWEGMTVECERCNGIGGFMGVECSLCDALGRVVRT